MTENPAKLIKRIKEILHKRDCRLAPVSYLFDKKGVILVSLGPDLGFDDLFEVAIEGGAEDVIERDDEAGAVLYEVDLHFSKQNMADRYRSSHHQHSWEISRRSCLIRRTAVRTA
jgi:transcriptional/translational regulatory protein YebC/TACO1